MGPQLYFFWGNWVWPHVMVGRRRFCIEFGPVMFHFAYRRAQ